MSDVATKTREYLAERITHLEKEVETVSVQSGVLLFTMKSMITELQQAQNVLNGGKSIFQKVEDLSHA